MFIWSSHIPEYHPCLLFTNDISVKRPTTDAVSSRLNAKNSGKDDEGTSLLSKFRSRLARPKQESTR